METRWEIVCTLHKEQFQRRVQEKEMKFPPDLEGKWQQKVLINMK